MSPAKFLSQSPLSFPRFDSVQRTPEIPKSGLGYRNSKRSIRRRPPSDHHGSEICRSSSTGQAPDRWDSSSSSPIADKGGGRNGRMKKLNHGVSSGRSAVQRHAKGGWDHWVLAGGPPVGQLVKGTTLVWTMGAAIWVLM